MNINELELDNIGVWPLSIRIFAIAAVFVLICVGGYWLDNRNQLNVLAIAKNSEHDLKNSFATKQQLAANLENYKRQLADMENTFGTLLRQLPSSTEVPGLLEDISKTAVKSGLEFDVIRPQPEQPKDFYAELPIEISVHGNYHQLATFVSHLASLPRIVTLHNFSISTQKAASTSPANATSKRGFSLDMKILAKTYSYTADIPTESPTPSTH